jgi:hypothetical protein
VAAAENWRATEAKGAPCCIWVISWLAPWMAASMPPTRLASRKTSLIWYWGLEAVAVIDGLLVHGLDLVLADPQARAVAAADPALPAHLGADLLA